MVTRNIITVETKFKKVVIEIEDAFVADKLVSSVNEYCLRRNNTDLGEQFLSFKNDLNKAMSKITE